jgi:hypothetical protein
MQSDLCKGCKGQRPRPQHWGTDQAAEVYRNSQRGKTANVQVLEALETRKATPGEYFEKD